MFIRFFASTSRACNQCNQCNRCHISAIGAIGYRSYGEGEGSCGLQSSNQAIKQSHNRTIAQSHNRTIMTAPPLATPQHVTATTCPTT
eukprot:1502791-Prymnesium_polylepis.1